MLIGAAVGAGIGALSTYLQSEEQSGKVRRQKRLAEEAYRYERQYQDAGFNLQRDQAQETLRIQRNRLGEALGADVTGFNLGLEGQALAIQNAQISLAQNAGSAQAWQGASGTRGGEATGRNLAYEQRAFERQTDLQERSNALNLRTMTRQYSYQFDDIGRELASWDEGGYRFRAKQLSDIYAGQMHDLKMREYDLAMRDAEASPLDYFSNMLGGAMSGASFGGQIDSLVQQQETGENIKKIKETFSNGSGMSVAGDSYLPAAGQEAAGGSSAVPWGNNDYGVSSWEDVFDYYSNQRNTDMQSIPFLQGIGLSPEQVSAFDSKMGEYFRKNNRAGRRQYTRQFFEDLGW
jgi:hypothetical protein